MKKFEHKSYLELKSKGSGSIPGSGSYIGSWASTLTFAVGDIVNYNGTLYEYVDPVPSAGSIPGTSPKWEVYMKSERIYSITDPDSTTPAVVITASDDRFTAAGHGLLDGMAVKFAVGGGGTLPPEIVAGTTYYVTGATASYFKVSATYGGGIIDISVDSTAPVTFQTVDAATSTYVVDLYSGSLITLTGAGLAQILRTPSHALPGKEFSVINDGTSGANTIIIQFGSGSVTLHAGESQKFIWDGAEWVIGTGIDADDVDYTPHGEVTQINVQNAIDKLIDIRWQKQIYNDTGAPISEKIVKLSGYEGTSGASKITDVTNVLDIPFGFIGSSVATGGTGYAYIRKEYVTTGLDTSASVVGNPVYFDATGSLTLSNTGSVAIGYVLTLANPGTIFINTSSYDTQSSYKTVKCATTGNIAIATALNAGDVIDTVTLAAGDPVLVWKQTTASENGIFIVGATPVRASNFNSEASILGATVAVQYGLVNGGILANCINSGTITVGSTPIIFDSFNYPDVSGESAAKTIYVKTTGNDSTGDGSSGNPYYSIHRAIKDIKNLIGGIDTSASFIVTVSVEPGTYDYSALSNFMFRKQFQQSGNTVRVYFRTSATTKADAFNTIETNNFDLLATYNIATTYAAGDRVVYNNIQYESKVGANLGNDPTARDSAYWLDVSNIHYRTGAGWTPNAFQGQFVYMTSVHSGSLPSESDIAVSPRLVPILRNGTDWIETAWNSSNNHINGYEIVTHKTVLNFGAKRISFNSDFDTQIRCFELTTTSNIGSWKSFMGLVNKGTTPQFQNCKMTCSYIAAYDTTITRSYLNTTSASSLSGCYAFIDSVLLSGYTSSSYSLQIYYGYIRNSLIYRAVKAGIGVRMLWSYYNPYNFEQRNKFINLKTAINLYQVPFLTFYSSSATTNPQVFIDNCDFFLSSSFDENVNVRTTPNGLLIDFESEPNTARFTIDEVSGETEYYNQRKGLNVLAIAPNAYNVIRYETVENLDCDTGTEVLDYFPDTMCNAVRWDVVLWKGALLRTFTIMAAWDAGSDAINDSGKHSIVNVGAVGDADVDVSVDINSNNVRLLVTAATDNWMARCQRYVI